MEDGFLRSLLRRVEDEVVVVVVVVIGFWELLRREKVCYHFEVG